MALNRSLAVASLAVTMAASALGQTPANTSSETPTVDQIIDRYGEAVGGRAAWQKLSSRLSIGTIEVTSANLSGTVVIHEKAPNKILTIILVAGSAFRQGFDGTAGWTEDPQNGLRQQTGAELAEAKRQSDFYGPFDLRDHYSKLTLLGLEKVNDHDAYVLEAALPGGGQPDKLYFDRESGLPLRLISQHHSFEGTAQFQEDFSDYRELDGVTLPFRISQAAGEQAFTVSIGEVRHNLPLEDSEFAKPAVQ